MVESAPEQNAQPEELDVADDGLIMIGMSEQAHFEKKSKSSALKPLLEDITKWKALMSEEEKQKFDKSLMPAKECEGDDEAQTRRKALLKEFHEEFKNCNESENGVLVKEQFRNFQRAMDDQAER